MSLEDDRRVVAVVLAGGTGTRVGHDLPKQLLKVVGRTILEHTVAAFDAHADVDDVVVMMAAGHVPAARAVVGAFPKVVGVHEGAATRSGTTLRALTLLGGSSDDPKVLLHDAARPLVSARVISDCIAALDEYDAVEAAVPTADTIIEVAQDGTLKGVPRRATLRRVQTPQGFRLSTIQEAYAQASADPTFEATDDASVVHRYLPDVPVLVVPGDERNIKVTDPVDLHLVEQLLRRSTDRRD